MTPRVKQTASISIGEFFERHAGALSLTLLGEKHGFERPISEPAPNRPGLALAGFFSYFAKKRIQVLGNSEISYLKKLTPQMSSERFRRVSAIRRPIRSSTSRPARSSYRQSWRPGMRTAPCAVV